jgi:hypothetical protein
MKRYFSILFAALLGAVALIPVSARADSDDYNRRHADYDTNHHHLAWVHRHFIWVHGHRVFWVPGHPSVD